MSEYQRIIHLRTYARWSHKEQRRETWDETCRRYVDFFTQYTSEERDYDLTEDGVAESLYNAIHDMRAMPSMRALWSAGEALARDHIAAFNCSYVPIDHVRAFDEILYILMCGTGVGFSVERQYTNKLPEVPSELYPSDTTIVVADSKMGWAKAYKQFIALLYSGEIPKWDVSGLRPAGAVLKVFGGRSSGPGPLVDLFKFTIRIFQNAKGRKLESIEVHDIVCKIGACVVSGGVRRSALISLSNLSDQRMRDAKSGDWRTVEPQRELANNSVAYSEKPEVGHFMQEWLSLYQSKSGERGIFNRKAALMHSAKINRTVEIDGNPIDFGTNPCGEIILRPNEFCNLSEVVARYDDTVASLVEKVRLATIMGTLQSCLTDYKYIREIWRRNSSEERLLGVSITGVMDCPLLNTVCDETKNLLEALKQVAVDTNKEWAVRLGIPPSAAITCNKPSGTVSQQVDSSSGIHGRQFRYYIRRVRVDRKDPLSQFLIDVGYTYEEDEKQPTHMVFSFPAKAPETARIDSEIPALEMLEIWKMYREHWCHHNPSTTITVMEKEWPSVGAWIWENFDKATGLAFLPLSNHSYTLAPYEEITSAQYEELASMIPRNVNWDAFCSYEQEDHTVGAQELACVGGSCEIR